MEEIDRITNEMVLENRPLEEIEEFINEYRRTHRSKTCSRYTFRSNENTGLILNNIPKGEVSKFINRCIEKYNEDV